MGVGSRVQEDRAMTRLALCFLMLATGASATENVIDVQHDSQLRAGNERQLSPHEQDTPTPAKAPVRWNEERYEL
ncbi:hypothetical protein D3C77_222770 [compost metagenome]